MIELKVTSLLPTRLDKYLMQEFPALGLGRLNKALRENKIKLNVDRHTYFVQALIYADAFKIAVRLAIYFVFAVYFCTYRKTFSGKILT